MLVLRVQLYGVPESAAEVAAQGTGLPRTLTLGQVWTNTKVRPNQ